MTGSSSAPELTVLGEIAAGGMGSVELARMVDGRGESLVAVKRMHPEHARDLEFVKMFRDEIWLMGALRHPNLVALLGWGEDEGGPYLVMQYIDGVPLGRIAGVGRRAREPMPEWLVAHVAARAAEGLHAAHVLHDERGKPLEIVHRDVTPSNVLVGFDGAVLVTDFGIAKAAGKSSHTRTGIIKGKIGYMSPEYAVRRPVDGRADLYSLGVVMYEILSGELPFEARTDFELLKKVAYGQAPSVLEVAPDVDPKLAAIIDRLLAKEPRERPADGAETARLLDGWLEEKGHSPGALVSELAAYASRHAGTKHNRVKQLLDPEADTTPDDKDGPKRPKFITLGTHTYTAFSPPPAAEPKELDDSPEEDRPRTRRVSIAPPSSPVQQVPRSAPASAPEPEPEPSGPSRTSALPGAGLTPVVATRAIRAHSSAVLGGVVAGSLVALILIVVAVAFATRRRSEPAVAEQPAEPTPTASAVTTVPSVPEPVAAVVAPPEPLSPPEPSAVPAPPKPLRPPVKTSKPPVKGKPPCTPTSFDYPSCLKR